MFRKPFFFTLLFSVTLLVLVPLSLAKSKNKGKSSQFKTMARLTTCCGDPAPGVKGYVDYKAKTKRGRLDRIDLKTVVELTPPIAAALPQDPDLRVILSDDGVEYAECLLVPEDDDDDGGEDDEGEDDEGEDDEDKDEVEFKLDLRQKKGRFEEKRGSCDTDLVTTGVQHGIPVIEVGDVATVTFMRDPLDRSRDIDFLMKVWGKFSFWSTLSSIDQRDVPS